MRHCEVLGTGRYSFFFFLLIARHNVATMLDSPTSTQFWGRGKDNHLCLSFAFLPFLSFFSLPLASPSLLSPPFTLSASTNLSFSFIMKEDKTLKTDPLFLPKCSQSLPVLGWRDLEGSLHNNTSLCLRSIHQGSRKIFFHFGKRQSKIVA